MKEKTNFMFMLAQCALGLYTLGIFTNATAQYGACFVTIGGLVLSAALALLGGFTAWGIYKDMGKE